MGENEAQIDGCHIAGESSTERRKYGFADRRTTTNDIVVPKSERRIPEHTEMLVPTPIPLVVRVLTSIDLNDQLGLATSEVGNVRADGQLAYEMVAVEAVRLQFGP